MRYWEMGEIEKGSVSKMIKKRVGTGRSFSRKWQLNTRGLPAANNRGNARCKLGLSKSISHKIWSMGSVQVDVSRNSTRVQSYINLLFEIIDSWHARKRVRSFSPSWTNISQRLKERGRKYFIVGIVAVDQKRRIIGVVAEFVINSSNTSRCHVSTYDIVQRTKFKQLLSRDQTWRG